MTLVEFEDGGAVFDPDTLPERTVKRQLFWHPQNHLKGIAQDNALHHYVYDAIGERSLKSEGNARNIFANGNIRPSRPRTTMEPYTYYPNGYTVVNGAQLSKHYYIGGNKVAAKVTDLPSHGFISEQAPVFNELSGLSMGEVEAMVREAGYPPVAWANVIDSTLETEETCGNAVLAAASGFNPKSSCHKKLMVGYNDALLNGGMCDFWHTFKLDDCMIDQPNNGSQDYQTYWVHPDHLGSGSVITNQNGLTTNWYEYMPFGETLMEQNSGEYNNVYKYNGKELDEATQLYYYGARYYDPNTSVWLSVDPLAIYHPVNETEFYGDGQHNGGVYYSGNLNPYIYTYQNPIKYIDPNGKQVDFNFFDQTKDTQLYNGGSYIKKQPGVLQITGHGNVNKGLVIGENNYIGNYQKFNEVFSKKSSEWKNRKNPMIVMIYACLLGKNKDGKNTSTLQDISKGSNDIFVGGTKQVWDYEGGTQLVYGKEINGAGGVSMNKNDPGSWAIVRDGDVIGYLPGNLKELTPELVNKVVKNYDNLKNDLNSQNVKNEIRNYKRESFKKEMDNTRTK
ncbi:tRNA(Glu)-specific nuclease WapA precursor [compost metagenome]